MSSTPTSTGTPKQIGPYRIEREIARGGMGIVYLARDTRLDRWVAIKALPDDVAAHPDRLARFEREAKTLASLNHPNVAGIYGVEESGGRRYLALEHIEGETLAARLARGPLSLQETLEICAQIAAGVEAAHESGVLHRDLKPGNVMVTPGEHVKVLDFGLAKGRVAPEAERGAPIDSPTLSSPTLPHSPTIHGPATLPGVILGTASYLSPEQARGKAVDRRTDIWSFGCVLCECLTGRRVFEGETISDTIAKILERDADFSRLPKQTPSRIRELLRRCLEKDPRKRLRDIGEARLVLEEVREGRPAAPGEAPPPPTHPIARAREAMRSHGFLFAAGLILGALLGLNMWGSLSSGVRTGVKDVLRVSIAIPPELRASEVQLTPDGKAEVISAVRRSPSGGAELAAKLYVRRLDKETFEPLRGTDGINRFSISPDSRWIAFRAPTSERLSQLRLLKVPLDGSAPPTPIMSWDNTWFGPPIWLHSGAMVVMRDRGREFVFLGAKGVSAPTRLRMNVAGADAQFTGQPLPGDRAAFLLLRTYAGGAYYEGTAVVDLKSGSVRALMRDGSNPRYAPTKHLLFTRGDVLYAAPFDLGKLELRGEPVAIRDGLRRPGWESASFGLSETGILQTEPGGASGQDRRAIIVDLRGTVADWSPERRAFENAFAASPDGQKLATVIANPASTLFEIWILGRGQPSMHRAVAVPGADVDGPAWSPDGSRLSFMQRSRSSTDGIYVADLSGASPPRRIVRTDPGVMYATHSWSPDGRQILCSTSQSYDLRLFVATVPAVGSPELELRQLFAGNVRRAGGRFSPDGKWIAYVSDETGNMEVYVSAWASAGPTGPSFPISLGEGVRPRWSADGKRLFYLVRSQGKVMSVDVTTAPRFSVSTPAVAFDLGAYRVAENLYDILPDGRMVAIQKAPGEDDITRSDLTLNFFDELKEMLTAARRSR